MDVTSVIRELVELAGKAPIFNPVQDPERQIHEWMCWSARMTLVHKWAEQCTKRSQSAKKPPESTSTTRNRSLDLIGRP